MTKRVLVLRCWWEMVCEGLCSRKCHLFRKESCLTHLFTRAKSLDGFFCSVNKATQCRLNAFELWYSCELSWWKLQRHPNIKANLAWIKWIWGGFLGLFASAMSSRSSHQRLRCFHFHAAGTPQPPLLHVLPVLSRSPILHSSLERPCHSQLMLRRKEPRSIVCLLAL